MGIGDKCCYCIHERPETSSCPEIQSKGCLFQPNYKGLKLISVLSSKLFQNWLKNFRADLDTIDKTAKVFLCGGLLKRGFTKGDIDILITSEEKEDGAFSLLIKEWLGKRINKTEPKDWSHNTKRVRDLLLDFWVYDKETLPSIKAKLTLDLREGLVRMRIA